MYMHSWFSGVCFEHLRLYDVLRIHATVVKLNGKAVEQRVRNRSRDNESRNDPTFYFTNQNERILEHPPNRKRTLFGVAVGEKCVKPTLVVPSISLECYKRKSRTEKERNVIQTAALAVVVTESPTIMAIIHTILKLDHLVPIDSTAPGMDDIGIVLILFVSSSPSSSAARKLSWWRYTTRNGTDHPPSLIPHRVDRNAIGGTLSTTSVRTQQQQQQ